MGIFTVPTEKEKKVLTMAEYISKTALYGEVAKLEELARNRYLDTPSNSPAYPRYTAQMQERASLKHLIADFPADDVAPVRHGRWTDGDPYCPICRKNKFVGLDADIWADWKPDYCPNCGANMDGGDGNSDME